MTTVARVTTITFRSEKSFEDAAPEGVARAARRCATSAAPG